MKYDKKFDEFCDQIYKIRGAEVYLAYGEDDNPYVELPIMTSRFIEQAHSLICQYGYTVVDESECEGSDYPSYCIWFN